MYYFVLIILIIFGCAANTPGKRTNDKKQHPQTEQDTPDQEEHELPFLVNDDHKTTLVKEKTVYVEEGTQKLTVSLNPENEFYKELHKNGDSKSLEQNAENFDARWGVYLFSKEMKGKFERQGFRVLGGGGVKDLTREEGVSISDSKDPYKLTIDFSEKLSNLKKEDEVIALHLIVYRKFDDPKNSNKPEISGSFEFAYLFTLYIEEMKNIKV